MQINEAKPISTRRVVTRSRKSSEIVLALQAMTPMTARDIECDTPAEAKKVQSKVCAAVKKLGMQARAFCSGSTVTVENYGHVGDE